MHAQVSQGQPGWQRMFDKRPGGFGHQDLPAVSGAGDARCPMYVQAEVLVSDERRLAAVQADPYPDLPILRPGTLRREVRGRDSDACRRVDPGRG